MRGGAGRVWSGQVGTGGTGRNETALDRTGFCATFCVRTRVGSEIQVELANYWVGKLKFSVFPVSTPICPSPKFAR